MNIKMAFLVLGTISTLTVSGCDYKKGGVDIAGCDHTQPESFTIKITAGENKSKPPTVDMKTVVACQEDKIVFVATDFDSSFDIVFTKGSPFGRNLSSSNGTVTAQVKANPKANEKRFKYNVIVQGQPELDPWIIIKRR